MNDYIQVDSYTEFLIFSILFKPRISIYIATDFIKEKCILSYIWNFVELTFFVLNLFNNL